MINKMKNKMLAIKGKKGFITIDAIFAIVVSLVFALLFIGLMFLMIPKFTMQGEVHSLAQLARIQGGLTQEDVNEFKTKLSESGGYDKDDIYVVLKDESTGTKYDNITDANYSKRADGKMLQLYVIVPTNKAILAPLNFFGLTNVDFLEYYNFTETVVSEKW